MLTYPSFNAGVQEYARLLGEVIGRDARGLVIDLRENRGGLAEQCLLAASLLAGEVEVVMRAPGTPDQRLSAVRGELRQPFLNGGGWNTLRVLPDLMYQGHVALLVNARSASCAEAESTGREAGPGVRRKDPWRREFRGKRLAAGRHTGRFNAALEPTRPAAPSVHFPGRLAAGRPDHPGPHRGRYPTGPRTGRPEGGEHDRPVAGQLGTQTPCGHGTGPCVYLTLKLGTLSP